ncbi:RiPP maturation radical SAM C-methyltransferase [Azospirillum sp. ST 5-10]|uniref:RiPP maturation radical SAM C-methyltransferase n=1 Tax=unclassified Azospirillum TaxID=2630922 RepID=UPI003F4A0AE7
MAFPPSDAGASGPRVLLILPPWAAPEFPGLSVALLRSILLSQGIPCDVFYANLLLSKEIGGDPLFEQDFARTPHAEMAFSPFYFDTDRGAAANLLRHRVGHLLYGTARDRPSLWPDLLDHVARFLDDAMAAVDWSAYDVVGFSLMFQQNLAALALARRIKAVRPGTAVVFGGPSCGEPMGPELLRSFPEIDYVVTGDGDAVIGPLVRAIRSDAAPLPPGVLRRGPDGLPESTGAAEPFGRLDELPVPDYGPYFDQVERLGLRHVEPWLYVENSRGCWWGEKHHCTFCGIADLAMRFRSKSPTRIEEELVTLAGRHARTAFLTADNILDNRYYDTLLPRLKRLREEEGYDLTFFFELKANVTRKKVAKLRDAGVVQVQPGIESFGDAILGRMDKGATGLQQVQTLKFLAEFDIEAVWNLIIMNPGDAPEDYEEMVDLMRAMHHLPPPATAPVQMLLQRYSVYFEDPGRFGLDGIRPQPYYAEIFPRAGIALDRLAFFFEYDRRALETDALRAAYAAVEDALDTWRASHVPDALVQRRGPGFLEVHDARVWLPDGRRRGTAGAAPDRIVLDGLAADLLAACGSVVGEDRLVAGFADRAGAAAVRRTLDELRGRGLVVGDRRGRLLALPLLKDRRERFLGAAGTDA